MNINIINKDLVNLVKNKKTPWLTVKELIGANWVVENKIGVAHTVIQSNNFVSQLQLVRMMQNQLKDDTIAEALDKVKDFSIYSIDATVLIQKAMIALLKKLIYDKGNGEYEPLLANVSNGDLWRIYILDGVLFLASPSRHGLDRLIYPILHKDTKEIVTVYGGNK